MSKLSIPCREREVAILNKMWKSKEAEFLAIYGRRRVGKTHLIRSFFSDKSVFFELTGVKDATLAVQLGHFVEKLGKIFYEGLPISRPKNWLHAFALLTEAMKKIPKHKKIVLFFDELPWLASKRSGITQALDYYWNTEWSRLANVTVVACGSAASWMLDNLINAKGGLHNRLTKIIHLQPFSLKQTKEFLSSRKIQYNSLQLLDLYMVTGGIPYYLKQIERGKSVLQNIDMLCFSPEGILYSEFERLFQSLFEKADIHLQIVREISKQRYGISRVTLLNTLQISSGGTLSKRIEELEACGFVKTFVPYGNKKRDLYYRLVDEYAQFYLQWIEPIAKNTIGGSGYWEKIASTPARSNWAGLAFEAICFKHSKEIANALGLQNIPYTTGWWSYRSPAGTAATGAQVDLLFDRPDGIISLFEIKYSDKAFAIDKPCAKILANKIRVFNEQENTKKTLSLVMITTRGVKENIWSEELVDSQITLDQLLLG
ncbi:MAG: ATP-binding protein [Chlamydiales bacterium]|nr:ATP-binding protein [Chlamydiales bacterium]